MVDVDNPWKEERPVFDSTFCPEIWYHSINNWIDKATEGEVYFSGSFQRFLIWIYNMRISYPDQPIYLCDDNITNAFHLIKINPDLVSMHAYVGCSKLVLCTGNTFGNRNCPANFDQPATAVPNMLRGFFSIVVKTVRKNTRRNWRKFKPKIWMIVFHFRRRKQIHSILE